ncbi:COMM domain containing 5 Like Sm protein 4 isoform X2 [Tachypleus tridentatus]|uniref:COMM domain containing 5 Like Sm protein 4 isoform X2 n=1 Tax=Tachypleus tridentatus TaxID=6853 RepID=UPI003FD2D7C7
MASIVGRSAGVGIVERTLFLGPRIPNEVKSLGNNLLSVDRKNFRSLLKLLVAHFEGKTVTEDEYQNIRSSVTNGDQIDLIYSGLYFLLRAALKLPESGLKKEVFKEDLRELKIADDHITDLVSIVFGSRCFIEKAGIENAPHFPHLQQCRWRVDVAISTSSLNRVLEPSVLMKMDTSDGKEHTFEMQLAKFHELRFAVASLLKEMEDVEKRNVMKAPV